MKKVFQQKIDPNQGDCMQAVVASLFEMELKDVPPFIEFGQEWFEKFWQFLKSIGYEYNGMKHNHKYSKLLHPTDECFEKKNYRQMLGSISRMEGVNGYFFASVLSPKFFSWSNPVTHAVVIDKKLNIVHDPNPNYQNIVQYPLADIIGYNGIIDFFMIEKIK